MNLAHSGIAALCAAFLLLGCAGTATLPPKYAGVSPPRVDAEVFVMEDGTRLPVQRWLPEGKVRAIVLAIHGFNDYSHAFAGPGAEWARQGIATYAYDQRGFGASARPGSWAGTAVLDDDLATAARIVRARHPGVPLYLLGESMGGAVVITAETGAAGAERPKADGVILVAPAVWGAQTMNIFLRVTLWTMDLIAPRMTFTGESLHIRPSDNIEMLRQLSRDPLVIKDTRVATIAGLVELMSDAFAAAPRFNERTLLLYGAKDEVIPKAPMQRFIGALPPVAPGQRVVAYYDQGYHMLLRDLEAPTVDRDVESWILSPGAPLPSGSDKSARAALLPES